MTDPIRMIRLSEELRERLRCHLPGPGIHPTAIEGLNLVLREESGKAEKCFERPLVGLVVQGTKHSFMGGRDYTYGDGQSVVVAVDMPIISYVTDLSPDRPFLFIYLYLNKAMIASLVAEMRSDLPPCRRGPMPYPWLAPMRTSWRCSTVCWACWISLDKSACARP